ncbi:MAG: NADH-quinone oxidoreductase subunit NuoE [Bacillota bacterium]
MEGELEKIRSEVEKALAKHGSDREKLLPVLQEVQGKLGYLPKEAMLQVAGAIKIPEVEVYEVATFYNQFRLNPPGKHQVKVCMGTACHMTGGQIIMDSFERRLEIKEGETTPDREFSLERVACVGCCALAPVVVVDEKVESKVRPTRVDGILLGFEMEKQAAEKKQQAEGEEKQQAEEGRKS